MTTPRITNGLRIRRARDDRGWNQATLAEQLSAIGGLHVSQGTVSRIETGGYISPAIRTALVAVLPALELLDDATPDEPADGNVTAISLAPVYDADSIAVHIGVDRKHILAAFRAGQLRGRKVGRRWVATAEAIATYLAGETPGASTATLGGFTPVTRPPAS